MNVDLFSLEGIITDAANCSLCVFIVLTMCRFFDVKPAVQLILAIGCLAPFLLNQVLFPISYMPDQGKYFTEIVKARAFESEDFLSSGSVAQASFFMAFVPIPFLDSVRSVGFISKMIYFVLLYSLVKTQSLSKIAGIFLLAYPSLLLYSSLGLRDTLILFFMVASSIGMVKGRYLYSLLFMAPLFFIKFQNFYIQLFFLTIYMVFSIRKNGLRAGRFVTLIIVMTTSAALAFPVFQADINFYRVAMHVEDGGFAEEIQNITGVLDFLVTGLFSAFVFLLKPFPWEVSNPLQLLQSVENLVVFYFLIKLTRISLKFDSSKAYFWILYLLCYSAIYGVVVSNYGTAARYKFTFVCVYVIFLSYEYIASSSKSRVDGNRPVNKQA